MHINTPIFFIVGRGRSGTTLLKSLLDANPYVSIPHESAFIKHLYKKYQYTNLWTPALVDKFIDDLYTEKFFEIVWKLDRNDLKKSILNHGQELTFQQVCKIIISNYKSIYPKEKIMIIGDKNPRNSLITEDLIQLFPEAKFIYIIRDYRDNVASHIKANFDNSKAPSLAYFWLKFNKYLSKCAKKYPDKFFTIKYETLVSEPQNQLQNICSFLDIPYIESMQDHSTLFKKEYKNILPTELIERYHSSLLEPINNTKIDSWKQKLTQKQIIQAEIIAGKKGEELGYKRSKKKYNFWDYIVLSPNLFFGIVHSLFEDTFNKLSLTYQLWIKNQIGKMTHFEKEFMETMKKG